MNEVEELKAENAELKAKIKKYAAINEQETKDYAELKAENQRLKKDKIGLHSEIKQLEQENAELKEENYQLQKDCQICENFIDFIPCKPIRDMDYDLQKVISQRDKYYQTLQEIKEICKNSHTSASEDYYRTADKIIQKITKLEGKE